MMMGTRNQFVTLDGNVTTKRQERQEVTTHSDAQISDLAIM